MMIGDLQKRVSRQIGIDRRYVPEIVAADWAMQHAEKIRDLLSDGKKARADDLGTQLGALYLNTICCANQYNVSLQGHYKDEKMGADITDLTPFEIGDSLPVSNQATALMNQTSRLGATLANYHGWRHSDVVPLGKVITPLHRIIYAIAKSEQIDLVRHVVATIDRARNSVQLNPLLESYHPSTSPVREEFKAIKDDSVCVYAKHAYSWGACPQSQGLSLQTVLHKNLDTFARFARATSHEAIDGFVFAFDGKYGSDIKQLSRLVYTVLKFYSDNDPRLGNSLGQLDTARWRFNFCEMDFFIQTFAPCYRANNSRFNHNQSKVFMQFVSDAAFHREVKRDPMRWQQAREVIRKRAIDTGQPYDVQEHDALTYVHPMRAGEEPVRWQAAKEIEE